jgi:hypothetical protein
MMSQRRAVNRTERRHLHQEMHLVGRGLEYEPGIFTEDELNAARREAIESVNDGRLRTLTRNVTLLIDDCEDLDERVDDVRRLLLSTRELLRGAVFGIHDDQRQIRTKLNRLTSSVDAIARGLRDPALAFGDFTSCFDCGEWYLRSHGCAIGHTETCDSPARASSTSSSTTRGWGEA